MTTLFIPVSTGPWLTIPAGSTNLPVTSAAGFEVGQKIGIDIGGNYELATVTAVGKAATQTTLAAAAVAGATNIKVAADCQHHGRRHADGGHRRTQGTRQGRERRHAGATARRRPGRPAQVRPHAGVDVSDAGTGISFSPATKIPAHERRRGAGAGQRHHARQPAGQEPRVRRARGQPLGRDRRLPGSAGAQSVVRRPALHQRRLDRAAGRQRRGGSRRHGLRIPAEQFERQRDHRQSRDRHPRGRPRQGWLHRSGARRGERLRAGRRHPTEVWAAFRTAPIPTASARFPDAARHHSAGRFARGRDQSSKSPAWRALPPARRSRSIRAPTIETAVIATVGTAGATTAGAATTWARP